MKTLHLVIITLCLSLAVPLVIHNVDATTPQLMFGSQGSGQGQLDTPRGITVDDSGNIYVADNRNHRVEEFDSSGKYVSEFDKGGIPEGIAIYNGTIYVVDRNNTSVEKFSSNGTLISSFGSAGTSMGQLSNPERIAIDSSGNIYVTDTGDIQKFNAKGNSISQFFANATQCCLNVMGIAIDSSNNIYVADMESHEIIKFSPAGLTLSEFNSTFSVPRISDTPQDVAVDAAGNIYVADTYNGRIVKLDSTGHQMSALDISGVPVGIAIKEDKVYATDLANNRVDIFLISQFVNNGTSIGSNSTQSKEIHLNQNSTALDAAIKFASSSPQFQSLVKGYNYTFSSDFEESGPLSTGGIGLTDHGFAFELYSGPVKPGKAVKVVEVLEDPTLTKILKVISYPAVYGGGPAFPSTPQQNSTSLYAQNNATLDVNTSSGQVVITGTVYASFSNPVVLKIQNPKGTLIAIDQLKPASDGTFSTTFGPSARLWSVPGNYTVTVSSNTQELGKTVFYFNGTNSPFPSLPRGINTMGRLLPLEQFKRGTAASDVKCNDGLLLVIKAEDGTPACVKPDTAQKLMEKGWTREVGTSNLNVDSSCNGTIILSPNYHAMMFPVLLMQSNSTSCVKLTYTVIRPYGVSEDGVSWPRNETVPLQISDLNYEGNANEFGITQGKDYTNSFNITAFPKMIDHANYPVGSNFTVTYLIQPLPNATGFYDQSAPMPLCFRYPLAVGHTAEQVNSSDFSKDLFIMLNHSCMRGQDELVGVEVKGMSYTEMNLS